MSEQVVGRRNALKYLGLLTGSAAGRAFLAAWLPSASNAFAATDSMGMASIHAMHGNPPSAKPLGPYTPQFFKPQEFETVEILTDLIIPADDKPGAKQALVAQYIDFVVASAAEREPKLQKDWTEGLTLLNKLSGEEFGKPFREIKATDREQLLTEMSAPEANSKTTHPGFSFYRLVKEMTVEGFYTSRIGLIDVLEYKGLAYLSEFPGCTHPEHQT